MDVCHNARLSLNSGGRKMKFTQLFVTGVLAVGLAGCSQAISSDGLDDVGASRERHLVETRIHCRSAGGVVTRHSCSSPLLGPSPYNTVVHLQSLAPQPYATVLHPTSRKNVLSDVLMAKNNVWRCNLLNFF